MLPVHKPDNVPMFVQGQVEDHRQDGSLCAVLDPIRCSELL